MALSELRALLGRPSRYRIDCPEGPDYLGSVKVGARWGCGCHGDGDDFRKLLMTPCAVHVDSVLARAASLRRELIAAEAG